jgi:DNA polymerase-4
VVGHSHVLPPALRNNRDAFSVLCRLTHKAAVRLRRMQYLAARFSCVVSYQNGRQWADDLTLPPTGDTLDFLRALTRLWVDYPVIGSSPMAVGMNLSDLILERLQTPSLFPEDHARRRLHEAMDWINECYGKNTIYFGGMHQARNTAPMRIAFQHLPERE